MDDVFDVKQAKKVEYEWSSVDDCIRKLIEYRKRGENVYIEIGNFVLYSSNVTLGISESIEYFLYREGFLKDDGDDLER